MEDKSKLSVWHVSTQRGALLVLFERYGGMVIYHFHNS